MRQERFLIAGAAVVLMTVACGKATSITGPDAPNLKPGFDLVSGPIALDLPWDAVETNPCNLDQVTAQGKMHVVFNSSVDASGGIHFTDNITDSGSGLGVPSGSNYQVVDNTTESDQQHDLQQTYKEEHQIVLAAQGPTVNYTRHVLIKVTFTPNGAPTGAEFAWMYNKCNGDGDKVDALP
jgi:hypothetical protein